MTKFKNLYVIALENAVKGMYDVDRKYVCFLENDKEIKIFPHSTYTHIISESTFFNSKEKAEEILGKFIFPLAPPKYIFRIIELYFHEYSCPKETQIWRD